MKIKNIVYIVLLLVCSAGAFYFWSTADRLRDGNTLDVSGNIEITQVQVSFSLPGRVEKRFVNEGDTIQVNQPIARLDASSLIQDVEISASGVEIARAAFLELVNGHLPEEIASAQARLDQADAALAYTSSDYLRQKGLFDRQVISQKEFDASASNYEQVVARQKDAAEQINLIQKGSRPEQILQARARLKQSRETLKQAEIRLSHASITAPISGQVLSTVVEEGEYVNAGTPIITLGNLEQIWLRTYIAESDLGRVKLGQTVHVTTDSYPNKNYLGKVSYIASEAEFTPKNVQTRKERIKLVYQIKVALENASHELKPGMPADARIFLDDEQ